jgi:broad specificity phosphatase PhoE
LTGVGAPSPARVILVKHALPVLDPSTPARNWQISAEGIAQAHRLAAALRPFAPLRLASSPEAKAVGTSEILATAFGVDIGIVDDLRELDRPVLPILATNEHEALNQRVFLECDQPVLGTESARAALDRFERAVRAQLAADDGCTPVVVSHGTVISLLVSAHNSIDAFTLWKTLKCPSFVRLDASFALDEIVEIL